MSSSENWKDKIDKVSETIDRAVGTNDFSNLSHRVTDLIDDARTSVIEAMGGTVVRPDEAALQKEEEERRHREEVQRVFVPPYTVTFRKTLMYVALAFVIIWGLVALALLAAALLSHRMGIIIVVLMLVSLVMVVLNLTFARIENRKTEFYLRYNTYRDKLEKHFYADVSTLAESVQQEKELTVRDLEEMSRERMFREGHFDSAKSCFIATDDLYGQYQKMELHRAAEQKRQAEERNTGTAYSEEVQKMLQEGQDYVAFLKETREQIADEAVSARLDRMTEIVSRIFVELQRHPEKAGKLRAFESYYMPTTRKLLTSYVSLSRQPVQSPKIVKAKKEIEDSLDPINSAFENLLDQLFGDVELDVASEISVMKSMMKQDGLAPDDLENIKNGKTDKDK